MQRIASACRQEGRRASIGRRVDHRDSHRGPPARQGAAEVPHWAIRRRRRVLEPMSRCRPCTGNSASTRHPEPWCSHLVHTARPKHIPYRSADEKKPRKSMTYGAGSGAVQGSNSHHKSLICNEYMWNHGIACPQNCPHTSPDPHGIHAIERIRTMLSGWARPPTWPARLYLSRSGRASA